MIETLKRWLGLNKWYEINHNYAPTHCKICGKRTVFIPGEFAILCTECRRVWIPRRKKEEG